MSLVVLKQPEPPTHADHFQMYEDDADNHVKAKNSLGVVTDFTSISQIEPYGSFFQYAEKKPMSSTSSSSLVDHLQFNTPALVAGVYIVSFYYNWGYSSTSRDFHAEIFVDGNDLMIHRQEPKDTGSDQRNIASGLIPVVLAAGVHEVSLMYGATNNYDTARIYNTNLMIWRAS